MSQLKDRLERDLREVAAGAEPSPSAWESIVARLDEDAASDLALVLPAATDRSRRPLWPAVAAVVLLVIIGSIAVLTTADDEPPSSTAFPDLTTTFVSPRNGFSIKYFDRGEGTVTPAKQLLGFSEEVDDGWDVVETGLAAVFKGASVELQRPAAVSLDDWVEDEYLPGGCDEPRSQQAEITIDGQPGRIAECPNHIEASVIADGRIYLFTLTHDRSDARAVFDAFIATVDLRPETTVDFPAMTTTFVSPTYGYSFKVYDRGGLAPATEPWDPGNQPIEARNLDPRFDAVETGMLAYFEGASTAIPDGVSIDAWVDELVTPKAAGGCGVPRSQQAAITIDGQPGRIAACDHTEATVVAGGRLYLFTGPAESRRNTAWFHDWVATIDLTPETAAAR